MQLHNHRIIIFILTIVTSTFGESTDEKNTRKSEIGFIAINDATFNTDKDYTGSFGIYYKLNSIPLQIRYQIDAYTPRIKYLNLTDAGRGIPPFAGFGFIGLTYKSPFNNFLLTTNLNIGSTGKYSFAHDVQDTIHGWLNQATIDGWDSQIEAKFAYVISPKLAYAFRTNYFMLIPQVQVAIGNLLEKQSLGLKILSGTKSNEDLLRKKYSYKVSYNIFIKYKLSRVSKNVFLTGFDENKHGVELENMVSEFKVGFDIQFKSYGLIFSNHYRSKEYNTQAKSNKFSTLILYYLF